MGRAPRRVRVRHSLIIPFINSARALGASEPSIPKPPRPKPPPKPLKLHEALAEAEVSAAELSARGGRDLRRQAGQVSEVDRVRPLP